MSARLRTSLAAAAVALSATFALTACASDSATGSTASGGAEDPIRIGVVGKADPQWIAFEKVAKDAGIAVELIDFSDYQLPNQALSEGDLDVNQFQHLQFLAEYNVKSGSDLTPIGASAVYPLGLYSTKHSSVAEIPDGGQIAIPNDQTNQARALLVLQEAGLIALKDGGNSLSTPADILQDTSKVTVTPVDAAQTALALEDVDASIINNAFVGNAGLSADDAIFSDDPDSDAAEPYINVWVTRAEDADNATYAKLVELYHSPEVEAAETENSGGTAVFKNNDKADLSAILAEIQKNIQATK
jgi:D-methionine transport system substrate-binding protein